MRPFRAFVAKLRGPLERMLDARAADEPYCGLCCCDVADHPVHYWTVGDDGQFAERFCGTPVPSSVSSAIEEEANAARRRNEADEHFDEDAQICECGHRSRNHAMKAFKYACCHHECDCNAFRGRAT